MFVLCLTEAQPHTWMTGKRGRNNGPRGRGRDRSLGERTSLRARVSETTRAFRCWLRARLWERHRPRSEQAGIPYYGTEGGSRAFA